MISYLIKCILENIKETRTFLKKRIKRFTCWLMRILIELVDLLLLKPKLMKFSLFKEIPTIQRMGGVDGLKSLLSILFITPSLASAN